MGASIVIRSGYHIGHMSMFVYLRIFWGQQQSEHF